MKSTLLIGAAGLAAAAVSTAAAAGDAKPPADDAKYLPWASVGGTAGDQTTGARVEFFAPVWQDLDSLLFVRVGVGTQTRDNEIANFGVGYRTKVDPDWILGVYGGFDATHTKFGHTYTQASLGAELMSADWDVRINGYLASQKLHDLADRYSLYVHDTHIAILQGQEGAYSGFDGEVGYRVFGSDSMDVRLFAGGFSFSRDDAVATSMGRTFDFAYKDMTGPMGRAEVDLYDIDALGGQSRITFDGQITHDDVRGTTGFVGASLRIPLGAGWGAGGQSLDELDRRMVDPVRRQNNVLTTWEYTKPEPVIIYNGTITSEPTNTLYYVSDDTPGAGSYQNPTSLGDATTRSAINPFIVVTDFGGPVTGGGTLYAGQTLVGGGETFSVLGTESSRVFTHDFAPGSGTPTLVPATPGGNILTIEGNTSIHNLNFGGDFGAAIYGHNIGNVDISHVTIDGSGGGQYGVQVNQDVSQDMNLHISDSTITGLGVYGVNVNTNVSDGGTSNQTIELTNSTISGSGVADVALSTGVSGGSTVNQSIVIDPTYISGGYYGILIGGYVNGAGSSLMQDIAISDVTVDNTKYAGIGITGVALNGGTLSQKIDLTNVTVTGSYAPIYFVGVGLYGGQVQQEIDLTNVSANFATYDENISVRAFAGYGGSVHQFGAWTNVVASFGYDDGVEFGANAYDGGTIVQNFAITGLTAIGNYDTGFDVYGLAFDLTGYYGPTTVAQYFTLGDAALIGNYFAGATADATAIGYYAATLQSLTVANSVLTGNGTGIFGDATAIFGGSAQQVVSLYNDVVDLNTYDGGHFTALGALGGFASQTVNAFYSDFSLNGGDGLYLGAVAIAGGNAEQNANIYFSTMDLNGADGLHVQSTAIGYSLGLYYPYYSQVTQNVIAAYDSMSLNGLNGAYIRNDVSYGGQLNQLLYFYGDTMNFNGISGVAENSTANAYGYYGYAIFSNLYSDLYVVGSEAMYNGLDGITVDSDMVGPGYLIQHIDVAATDASYNGRTGFVDYANAYGFYSLDIQYITLAGSRFDGNGLDGAAFLASQYYGPLSFGAAIQDVTIDGSDFSGNYRDGLYGAADASGLQGRTEQHFTIAYSRFDGNGRDGMYLRNSAHDGVYLPGYGCGQVQGLYGGCAFVRQTVDIYGSELNGNGNDGLQIVNYAGNYGAIYGLGGRPANVPTVFLYNTSLSYNGNDGLELINRANNSSYIYQYVLAVDSHFDHNGDFGIEGYNYAAGGSQLIQIVTLYSYATGTTVDGNASGGVQILSYSNGGYSFNSAMINQLNLLGADVSGNGGNGVGMAMYSYATYIALQNLNAIDSTFVNNAGYGVGVLSAGIGDYYNDQLVTASGSLFAYNGGIGLGVAQYDLNSIYANQTVAAIGNAFVDNVVGLAQVSYLAGTYAGSQTSVLAGNYFTGGNTALGGIAGDGASILFLTNNVGYGYATQTVVGNDFHNIANDALSIRVDASAYSYVYNYTYVAGNLIDGAGGAGIKVHLSASDYSLLTNNPAGPYGVVIAGNGIYNVGLTYLADGIDVKLSASDYGAVVGNYGGYLAPFGVVVAGNTVDGASGNGIRVGTDNYYGVIFAGPSIVSNTVGNVGGYGILVDSYNYGGVTGQLSTIAGNTVTGAYVGGIAVYNHELYGITLAVNYILGNTVSGAVQYAGINIVDSGSSGTILDATYVYGNSVANSDGGIGMYAYGDNSVAQYTYVAGNTLDTNTYGVVGIADGTTYQYISTYGQNVQTGTPPANYYYFYAAPGATQVVL